MIPSLPNKDWRQAAQQAGAARNGVGRKKREMYIPDAVGGMRAAGVVGDGSQGGLGTTDVINSTPVVGGLAVTAVREDKVAVEGEDIVMQGDAEEQEVTVTPAAPETDEQRALRELMSGGDGSATDPTPSISTIQSAADSRNLLGEGEPTDTSASSFQQDVHSRPDEATLSDYARVPVGEFGAAMLRGMGWKPGQAASRTERGKKGPVEAFVPTARPSLLGIGAKAMSEVLPQEKGKGVKKTSRREEMRFVPLLKKEREGSASASAGGGSGRSVSLSLSSAAALALASADSLL